EMGMTVFRVNKTGGGLTPLASNQVGCYGIAVQENYVYWTAGDKIMRTDKKDSLFVTVDSSGIYWTNNVPNGAAMRVSLSGGSAVVLVPGLDRPYLGALDANNFYFAAN